MEKSSRGNAVTAQFFLGTHALVITLLRHRLTGAIVASMFVLGLIGWFVTEVNVVR
jgi:hypothetical protein